VRIKSDNDRVTKYEPLSALDAGLGKGGFVRESVDGSAPLRSRGKATLGGLMDKSPRLSASYATMK